MKHPAKYSTAILDEFARHIAPSDKVLDPFGGTGLIHTLDAHTWDVEIEPEWSAMKVENVGGSALPTRLCGNALDLQFSDGFFDVIAVSPVYGNRFSDHHNAKDPSKRRSYTHDLRAATGDNERKLHPDNAGTLQWGEAYRAFHYDAWGEAIRVLRSGGLFLLNVKDHIRGGERQRVCEWHRKTIVRLGLIHEDTAKIEAPGLRYGENRERAGSELVYRFSKP